MERCNAAQEPDISGPAPERSLGSVLVNLQLACQVAMSLHPVPRPGQCSAQLVEYFAETRRADCLLQEIGTHGLPARCVQHLEERPCGRRQHSMLTPGDKLAASPVHIEFRIEQVG